MKKKHPLKSENVSKHELNISLMKILEELLDENCPSVAEIAHLFDNTYRSFDSNKKRMNIIKARLLNYVYGITLDDLMVHGYKSDLKTDVNGFDLIPNPKFKIDSVVGFHHIQNIQNNSSENEKQTFIKNYIELITPFINSSKQLLNINDYLNKGMKGIKPSSNSKIYFDLHNWIFKLIEKKLEIQKQEFFKIYSIEKDIRLEPLTTYKRVLQIQHLLTKGKDYERIRREALLLCPIQTFNHIINCLILKKNTNNENIKIFASPIGRPYQYAISDDQYYTEYLRVSNEVYYPDVIFIEKIDVSINHTKELYSLYQDEFANEENEIHIDYIEKLFGSLHSNNSNFEYNSIPEYLNEKVLKRIITSEEAKFLVQLSTDKYEILKKSVLY